MSEKSLEQVEQHWQRGERGAAARVLLGSWNEV